MEKLATIIFAVVLSMHCIQAERINHEGRILGSTPSVTNALLFNTPEADAVVSSLQIFPAENAWNEDISRRLLLTNSAEMITRISSDLAANRQTLRPFYEMTFVLVPDAQPLVPITFDVYGNESDPSPYPIPTNMPVEQWPRETGSLSLFDWQRDINDTGGDRHSIIVQPGTGNLWETWQSLLVITNGQTNWHASNGAKFSLTNNSLRPAGWTSADAAGLSMFAGLVRYDECQRGMVEHAIRLIVRKTRREYIYPATHYASTNPASSYNIPAMGQRLRLKSDFVIPGTWTIEEKAVLRALKKYGAIVADNGGFFSISVAPDPRFSESAFSHLSSINLTNFEVIQTTGAQGGPRSPGQPIVNAGADQTVAPGVAATLQGAIDYTNTAPLSTQWKLYSGPGNVIFGNSNEANTTVIFDLPGTYTLMISADDGIHSVAYDAVKINVAPMIRMQVDRNGTNITLQWSGGNPPYQIERATDLSSNQFAPFATTSGTSIVIPVNTNRAFYRVRFN